MPLREIPKLWPMLSLRQSLLDLHKQHRLHYLLNRIPHWNKLCQCQQLPCRYLS